MEEVYHSYYIDYSWRNDYDEYTHSNCHWGLIRHDELMAVISGGMPARKAFIESHSSLLYDEILDDVSLDYDLERKYDKHGRALDGGPNWINPLEKNASSSSNCKTNSYSYSSSSSATKTTGGRSSSHPAPTVTPRSNHSTPASDANTGPIIFFVIWLVGAVITFFIVRNESSLFLAIIKSVGWTFIVAYYLVKYAWLLVVWIISLFK